MKTVHEIAKMTGVSIRTLQYYDKIGLLLASQKTEANYRLYDDEALNKLGQIMLLKELEFSLADIKEIINNPGYDINSALGDQIELFKLKQKHIERLITFAINLKNGGQKIMDFKAFNNTEEKDYAKEAKERWGTTEAYQEFEAKHGKEDQKMIAEQMMAIFKEFGAIRTGNPNDQKAKELVKKLQSFITANYYNCTNEILLGLSEMYVGAPEFKANIDKNGGEGTAEFVRNAIVDALK